MNRPIWRENGLNWSKSKHDFMKIGVFAVFCPRKRIPYWSKSKQKIIGDSKNGEIFLMVLYYSRALFCLALFDGRTLCRSCFVPIISRI